MLSYGIGARTVEGEGPACNLFSTTGDYMDPFIENEEELINSYIGTIKSVKLALPIYFREIIKIVCDLAENEYFKAADLKEIKNYYILTILMAGCIDDVEETFNEILRASQLPVSVVVIKIGTHSEENDSKKI